jgi:hypothetical protein
MLAHRGLGDEQPQLLLGGAAIADAQRGGLGGGVERLQPPLWRSRSHESRVPSKPFRMTDPHRARRWPERGFHHWAHHLAADPVGGDGLWHFFRFSHWNHLFWPLIVVRSPEPNTPPPGLLDFHSGDAGDHYGELMAGTVIVSLPLVIGFLMAQWKFIEGISLGAVKG